MNQQSPLPLCLYSPVVFGSSIIEEVLDHAAYLGYDVQRTERRFEIAQPGRLSWVLFEHRGGVLFCKRYRASEAARHDRQALLALANEVNNEVSLTRLYVTPEGDLAIEGWYPNVYERTSFGRFVGTMDLELREQLERRKAETDRLLV